MFFQLEHTDSTSRCFVFEKRAERLKNATAWVPTKRSSTALITTRQRSTYYCIAINYIVEKGGGGGVANEFNREAFKHSVFNIKL